MICHIPYPFFGFSSSSDVILLLHGLNLGQAVHELGPILHDDFYSQISQQLVHLLLLHLPLVAPNVSNRWDPCPYRARGTALAILHRDTFAWLLANDFARMQINRRIWLCCRHRQTCRRTEDVVWREEFVLPHFLYAGLHSAQRTGTHDCQAVFFAVVELFQHGCAVDAGLGFGFEGFDDGAEFTGDVVVDFSGGEVEAVFFLEAHDNAVEVLADKGGHEARASVTIGDVLLGEHFVGELGAGFEGEFFGENKGIVAVEEEMSYLRIGRGGQICGQWRILERVNGDGLTLGMVRVERQKLAR